MNAQCSSHSHHFGSVGALPQKIALTWSTNSIRWNQQHRPIKHLRRIIENGGLTGIHEWAERGERPQDSAVRSNGGWLFNCGTPCYQIVQAGFDAE